MDDMLSIEINSSLIMFKYIALFALIALAAASDESGVEIKVLESDVRADGSKYIVELSNGARAEQSTDDKGNAEGSFGWTDPNGERIELTYVANENGYQPQSNSLPTPPPIPEAILKSLAWLTAHQVKDDSKNE